jgi:transposase
MKRAARLGHQKTAAPQVVSLDRRLTHTQPRRTRECTLGSTIGSARYMRKGAALMADPWIKMRTTLPRCPQVVRLASAFDADRCPLPVRMLSALGALHVTWSLFDAHSADGLMSGYTLDAVDLAVGVTGWGQAMVDVGWLVVSPCGVTVPEWETHNGTSSKRRLQDMERKRSVRTKSGQTSGREADAERTPSLSLSLSPSPSDLHLSQGETEGEPAAKPTGLARALQKHLGHLPAEVLQSARDWDDHAREAGPAMTERAWAVQLQRAGKDPAAWVAYVAENLGANTRRLQDPPKRAGGGQPYTKLTAREASAERHVAAWDEFINHLNTKDPQCLTPAPSAMLSAGSKTSPTPPLSPPTLPPGKNGSPGSTPR